MQSSWISVSIPIILAYFPPVLPEVLVSLDVELDQVANLDWVDLTSTTMAYLGRSEHGIVNIKHMLVGETL